MKSVAGRRGQAGDLMGTRPSHIGQGRSDPTCRSRLPRRISSGGERPRGTEARPLRPVSERSSPLFSPVSFTSTRARRERKLVTRSRARRQPVPLPPSLPSNVTSSTSASSHLSRRRTHSSSPSTRFIVTRGSSNPTTSLGRWLSASAFRTLQASPNLIARERRTQSSQPWPPWSTVRQCGPSQERRPPGDINHHLTPAAFTDTQLTTSPPHLTRATFTRCVSARPSQRCHRREKLTFVVRRPFSVLLSRSLSIVAAPAPGTAVPPRRPRVPRRRCPAGHGAAVFALCRRALVALRVDDPRPPRLPPLPRPAVDHVRRREPAGRGCLEGRRPHRHAVQAQAQAHPARPARAPPRGV